MTTTKEFKARHNLSDSAFKRLVKRVLTVHPNLSPITERSGSTSWTVNHVQVLEAHLLTDQGADDSTDANSYRTVGDDIPVVEATLEDAPTPLSSRIAALSTRLGDSAKHSAMSALAKTDSKPSAIVVPTSGDIDSANQALTKRQDDIDTLDGVLSTVLSGIKARNDIQDAQHREEARKKRKQELQNVELDEIRRVYEEQEARKRIRQALENGVDISEVLGDNISAIVDSLD